LIVAFDVACGIATGKTPSTLLQRSMEREVYLCDPTLATFRRKIRLSRIEVI
jgi:hypothetical protein